MPKSKNPSYVARFLIQPLVALHSSSVSFRHMPNWFRFDRVILIGSLESESSAFGLQGIGFYLHTQGFKAENFDASPSDNLGDGQRNTDNLIFDFQDTKYFENCLQYVIPFLDEGGLTAPCPSPPAHGCRNRAAIVLKNRYVFQPFFSIPTPAPKRDLFGGRTTMGANFMSSNNMEHSDITQFKQCTCCPNNKQQVNHRLCRWTYKV